MELRMADVLLASLAIAPGGPPSPASDASGWQRHLAFACEQMRGGASTPAALQLLALQDRDRAGELESCGIPQGVGSAPVPPPAAAPMPVNTAPENAPPQLPLQPADVGPERAPVRVHVDPTDAQGMTVWLGLDRAQLPAGEGAARVVADLLHALHATPQRLAALVCNGVTVYPAVVPVGARPQRATGAFLHASFKDLP